MGLALTQQKIICNSLTGDPLNQIEITNSQGTSLKYDGIQFNGNWNTPSGAAGNCYSVTLMTADGSSISAYFMLEGH